MQTGTIKENVVHTDNSVIRRVMPSLTNAMFTMGRVYAVYPTEENPANPNIGMVFDNLGHKRIILLSMMDGIGDKSPHLRPELPEPVDFLDSLCQGNRMGHFIEIRD